MSKGTDSVNSKLCELNQVIEFRFVIGTFFESIKSIKSIGRTSIAWSLEHFIFHWHLNA